MPKKRTTVSELAKEADLDADEVLMSLWDAGLLQYSGPADQIRGRDIKLARRALALPTSSDFVAPEYWSRRLGLSHEEFEALLAQLDIPMSPKAVRLRRGAVAALKRHAARTVAHPVLPPPADHPPPIPTFEWGTIGRTRQVRLLNTPEVEAIHWELVQDFATDSDPIDPPGVRSQQLLESAVYRQHTALGSERKYPTAEMVAAALFHSLVHDHPFHNGNKRTALVSMLVLLDENGLAPTCNEDELFQLVLRLSQHNVVPRGRDLGDREVIHISETLRDCTRPIEKGEQPLQWRRLRQILKSYNIDSLAMPGNRMHLTRRIAVRGLFGRQRERVLETQVKYADDGRQASINTVKQIRRQLELDESHGVDSADFYRQAAPVSSEFITRYRKTLKRLARL